MAESFTLDTSGRVAGAPYGLAVWYDWDDIGALPYGLFAQGCIRALLKQHRYSQWFFGQPEPVEPAFRHLAPATLARILKDCGEAWRDGYENTRAAGAVFYESRQRGLHLVSFPPLHLGDDGLIYFGEV